MVLRIQGNKYKCNFHHVAIPMMTLQILKSVDFTKTQKYRYLMNETLFFLRISGIIDYYFIMEFFKKFWGKIRKN